MAAALLFFFIMKSVLINTPPQFYRKNQYDWC